VTEWEVEITLLSNIYIVEAESAKEAQDKVRRSFIAGIEQNLAEVWATPASVEKGLAPNE